MARRRTTGNPLAGSRNLALVQAMQAKASGAGVHADQNTRRAAAGGRTNRVGSRSSQRRAAVRDGGW